MELPVRISPALLINLFAFIIIITCYSCANIIPPGGGPRDSLPPVLVSATPKDSSAFFNSNRITLNFDEYVVTDNIQENLIVSPNPKTPPVVESKLRTVTIRLKDTLEPNTTYSLNFGGAIKDVNEGNTEKNFTYLFSTGSTIDDNTLKGKVLLAETGKIDTTLLVVLHKNFDDSAIAKERPRYYAKLDGKGNFEFKNLPADSFAIYVTPNDYSKLYDDSTELFAFANEHVKTTGENNEPDTLYAYQLIKEKEKKPASASSSSGKNSGKKNAAKQDNILKLSSTANGGDQDLLSNLELAFNHKLKSFDSGKIHLSDTNFNAVNNATYSIDTTNTIINLQYNWPENTAFTLVIEKGAATDTNGVTLAKNDTISFTTKRESEYGSVRLRFKDIDLLKNPVLQLVQSDKIVESTALTSREWYRKLFKPGNYELRILYDDNKNGVWDPGSFFGVKRQPEIVQLIAKPLSFRANWDNETDINVQTNVNDVPATKK